MLLIEPDPTRRINIPGVPGPVRRPVDIDEAISGFSNLRTLRIYRFDEGSVIEGHAEGDEVYLIVLAGFLELTISTEVEEAPFESAMLSAPGFAREVACAAYLPPGSSYKLIAKSETDVAYARATPRSVRRPKIFPSPDQDSGGSIRLLLGDESCAERLRFSLVRIAAITEPISFSPTASELEQLIHVTSDVREQSTAASDADGFALVPFRSHDTLVVSPREQAVLDFAEGSRCLVLILTASGATGADTLA